MDPDIFKTIIQKRTGLVFEGQFSEKLETAIRERMAQTGVLSPPAYRDLLCGNPDEFTTLLDLITVNETYFFREPLHLEVFAGRLVPNLMKENKKQLRFLSAGCSTGEEIYSMVMALMERYGPDIGHLFTFTGFDIDASAVQKAKQGIYQPHSFRNMDPLLQAAYFDKTSPHTWKLKNVVMEKVKFQAFNLLSDPYPDHLRGTDIIFYRNVSIYFAPDTQKQIFKNLAAILNKGGYLVLSSTETLPHDIKLLSLIEREGMFLFVKEALTEPPGSGRKSETDSGMTKRSGRRRKKGLAPDDRMYARQYRPLENPEQDHVRDDVREEAPEKQVSRALSLAKTKQYDKALGLLDDLLADIPGHTGAHTLKASILANLEQEKAAREICTEVIEKDPLCLEAYLLLGVIALKNDEKKEAANRFKQALYLESSCWLAHFHLGRIYVATGEKEQAGREYRITIQLLEEEGISNPGLRFFPIKATCGQIMDLCRHYLANL